jgi:pSer/pThr/pTyr-binding forkhead associated (FHA) protein
MRFELADSVIMGRGREADINLDTVDAVNYGVSRKHAMLRPSRRALFFFDLGSTNGSRHNGIVTGNGAAVTLAVGDVIRLGKLALTIRRLEQV